MPGFLDLPACAVEQLAKVRLDEPIAEYVSEGIPLARKRRTRSFCFFVLRDVGHHGVATAAYGARHAVLKPTLANAAVLGDVEWCRVLLAQGEPVSRLKSSIWLRRKNTWAVQLAALHGHTAVAGLLMESGAGQGGSAMDALSCACIYGHTETARFLIERGGDVDTFYGRPLRHAARGGHVGTVELLLQHGAWPHRAPFGRKSAIKEARAGGHSAVVAMLKSAD